MYDSGRFWFTYEPADAANEEQPTPHFIRSFFRSGSFLGGKTPLVQAHTALDNARC
ncbi:hypothetical protein CAP2UW1_1900 [Candidatus Accumulibacter phosphatis]|uniref:Uncharacterized protein n=1 Tax=Accumulibacter regalis TaxID=522306 RepID=C7RVB9_ACCRE